MLERDWAGRPATDPSAGVAAAVAVAVAATLDPPAPETLWPPARWSRVVVGAYVAFLCGTLFLSVVGSNGLAGLFYVVLTIAVRGVIPVGVSALCGVPLLRALHNRRVPVLAQAVVVAVASAAVWAALAGVGFALAGDNGFGYAYLGAVVAAWCAFFGVLISRVLQRYARLFRVTVVAVIVSIAAGVAVTVATSVTGWPYVTG